MSVKNSGLIKNLSNNGSTNPIPFFSAGQSLNDKDKDFNIDLREIQDFFKPIDNLFGDYEIRKKFNLHLDLYRKKYFERGFKFDDFEGENYQPNIIKSEEFNLDILSNDDIKKSDSLALFFLIYDFDDDDIYLDYSLITSNCMKINNSQTFKTKVRNLKKFLIGKDAKIAQIFILDPEKLVEVSELDDAKQEYYRNKMIYDKKFDHISEKENSEIKKEFIDKVNFAIAALKLINQLNEEGEEELDYSESALENFLGDEETAIKMQNQLKFNDVETYNQYWDTNFKDILILILLFRNRVYKMKAFENHTVFRARIGYEDNHYVLFLHPYESESNNPIRVPPKPTQ